MKAYLRWITYFDNMRFGLESNLINMYGFGRCQTSQVVNQTDFLSLIPTEKMFEIYSSDKIDTESLLKNLEFMMSSSVMDDDQSFLISAFKLSDSYYFFAIAMLNLHFFTYYVITYLLIRMKK